MPDSTVTARDLHAAETDLATLRARLATVTQWIHNPTHDHAARQALAHALGLPEPRTEPQ